jgi:transcriptional regulator with XRE-family HTH domain
VTDEREEWEALGGAIRTRRVARDLTLVDLGGESQLSQPFLSQIENGRARPSMASLYRIAKALDTTPQALFGRSGSSSSAPVMVRADSRRTTVAADDESGAMVHLLLTGDAPFHVLEFTSLPREFQQYWQHDGFEATSVLSGEIEIDLDGVVSTMSAGDFVSYPAGMPHRLRCPSGEPVRVMLIETRVEAVQDPRPGSHVPPRSGEHR